MPKYRHPEPDIVSFSARTAQRVAKLERTPRALATSVDRGSLQFNGGELMLSPGNNKQEYPVLAAFGNPTELTKVIVLDNFDRNESSGWGNPSLDGNGFSYAAFAWTNAGGSGTDYTVTNITGNSGVGKISTSAVNSNRNVINGVSTCTDQKWLLTFSLPAMPTGGPVWLGTILRLGSFGSYQARIIVNPTGIVTMQITSRTASNVDTYLGTYNLPNLFVPTQNYQLETKVVGNTISMRMWKAGESKTDYQLVGVDPANTYPTGKSAIYLYLDAANTNTLPYAVSFTNVSLYVNTNEVGVFTLSANNGFELFRHDSNAPDAFVGQPAISFYDYPHDPTFPISTITIADQYGGQIFTDAAYGRGMADPRIQVDFFDPAATKSTTSATFTNFASCFWYVYHPVLRVTVLVNVPSATTYEIRMMENSHNQQALLSLTNTFGYYTMNVYRANTTDNGYNGNPLNLDLEWRRVSGTGTATMVIADAVGIDLPQKGGSV